MVNPNESVQRPSVDNKTSKTGNSEGSHRKKDPEGDFKEILESKEKDTEGGNEDPSSGFGTKKELKVANFDFLKGIQEEETPPSLFELAAPPPPKKLLSETPKPLVMKDPLADAQESKINPSSIKENTPLSEDEVKNFTPKKKNSSESSFSEKSPLHLTSESLNAIPSSQENKASTVVNQAAPLTSSAVNQTDRIEAIRIITDYIEKAAQVVDKGTVQTTTVTLARPPLFAGAELIVSADKADPKSLNIQFERLSPEAKGLLDTHQNRESLMQALNDKGYNLQNHSFSTSTQSNNPIYSESGQNQGSFKDQNKENHPEDSEDKRKNKDQNREYS